MAIGEKEIWACALQVMRTHGDGAALHAAMRADELLLAGDHEGSSTWIRIMKRVEALDRPPEAGPLN